MQTVAEGISDERQVQTLAGLGCEQGQGFFWTEPLLAPELERWLAEHAASPPPD